MSLEGKLLMALLFTRLFIKEKLLLFCQFSIILFFQWESYPHINYTISNRNTNKIFYYSMFLFFLFLFEESGDVF